MNKTMKKNKYFFSYVLILIFVFSLTSCFEIKSKSKKLKIDADEIRVSEYEPFIQNAEAYLYESNFHGAVLVGIKDQVIFASGYGLTDSKNSNSPKITAKSTFEIGSLTKQMTAAAIMQLAEQKKLAVTDSLSKYFPEYVHGQQITLEMLLNMRSGLTDYINSADEFFPRKVYNQIERAQIGNKPVDENIVLKYFYDAPLLTEPDSTYFYCNTNYYLLACIIEAVSGMSYSEYINKHIFSTAGMNSANLNFQNTDCKGYDYKGRYYSIPQALSKGCGDVNASVIDVFKWNCCFYDGKMVKAKSFKQMTNSRSYGYGVYCGPESYFHGGNTNVFNSYNAYYPKDKVSIVVLCNEPLSKASATITASNLYKIFKNFNK